MVMFPGDLIDAGTDPNNRADATTTAQWANWSAQASRLTRAGIPWTAVKGNHDNFDEYKTNVMDVMSSTYGSDYSAYDPNISGTHWIKTELGGRTIMFMQSDCALLEDEFTWIETELDAWTGLAFFNHHYAHAGLTTQACDNGFKRGATAAIAADPNFNPIRDIVIDRRDQILWAVSGHNAQGFWDFQPKDGTLSTRYFKHNHQASEDGGHYISLMYYDPQGQTMNWQTISPYNGWVIQTREQDVDPNRYTGTQEWGGTYGSHSTFDWVTQDSEVTVPDDIPINVDKTEGYPGFTIVEPLSQDWITHADCKTGWLINGTKRNLCDEGNFEILHDDSEGASGMLNFYGNATMSNDVIPAGSPTGHRSLWSSAIDPNNRGFAARTSVDLTSFTNPTDGSICGWFRRNIPLAGFNPGTGHRILHREGYYQIADKDDQRSYIIHDGTEANTTSNLVASGTWEHICMGWEDTGKTTTVWKNGVNDCEGDCVVYTTAGADPNEALFIGGTGSTSNAEAPGVYELAILDRNLSQAEACWIMKCGLDGTANDTIRQSTYGDCGTMAGPTGRTTCIEVE
jgi:hypothetical protein